MGIPLFITPVEPEIASKAADKTSARPRSSIRRQRPLERPSRSRAWADARRPRLLGMVVDDEAEQTEYEVVEAASQGGAPPRDADSTAPIPFQPPSRAFRLSSLAEGDVMRMRDQLSFERQHMSHSDVDGPLMPPVPESRDFAAAVAEDQRGQIADLLRLRQERYRQELRRMARRRPAPTPPYADGEIQYMVRARRAGIDSPRPSTLTSALSSSLSPSQQAEPRARDTLAESFLDSDNEPANYAPYSYNDSLDQSASSAQRSALAERVEALNRASSNFEARRRIIRQARLDGLGDRDRSLSPDGDVGAWDTLLGTITPDPQPPSAGSSFASSAAAASSSGSGPASASTSMTSVDPADATDPEVPAANDCDVSESASNTEEEEEEEEEDMYELRDRRGDRFWRTYTDVVNTRVDRAARMADTDHLDGMHRIISRLAERDEIPETWWASAGLSRNLRREPSA